MTIGFRARACTATALTLGMLGLFAESPAGRQAPRAEPLAATPTEFEVASLKRLPTPIMGWIQPDILPGRVRYDFAGFRNLIAQGFDLQQMQIVEGPGVAPELGQVHFELEAKTGLPLIAKAKAWEAIRPMLQKLLIDRFKLRFHREMREMRVYALVQMKEGAKLTPIKEEEDLSKVRPYGVSTGIGTATYSAAPLRFLCNVLSGRLKGPVVDETGLVGRFDFTVRWLDADGRNLPEATILREQLGLLLEERRRPVEMFIIDHAEMPAAE